MLDKFIKIIRNFLINKKRTYPIALLTSVTSTD